MFQTLLLFLLKETNQNNQTTEIDNPIVSYYNFKEENLTFHDSKERKNLNESRISLQALFDEIVNDEFFLAHCIRYIFYKYSAYYIFHTCFVSN